MAGRRVRIGVAGLGRAFSITLPALARHPRVELVAGADPRPEARDRFRSEFQARVYPAVADLCADPGLDAVYVATPHQCHLPDVLAAASHGRHVLVEKPMALTLADCRRMIDACRDAGVVLMVGHSHSFDAPVARARTIIDSGEVGPLRMISALNYTDFLYRPRRPEELDTAQGGGVVYNQAPHQVDVVRLLGGGMVESVTATLGMWDPARPTEGAYQARLRFTSGAFASLVYSGYGHFDSDELCDWIGESGEPKDPASYGSARRALAGLPQTTAEADAKAQRNYGGPGYSGPARVAAAARERHHQHFGFVVASCERGDVRPTAKGVHVYGDLERRFDPVPVPAVFRAEVMDEFAAAVLDGEAPLHDGEWGLATMEVCLAMLRSGREGREILMEHQVAASPRSRGKR